MSSPPPGGERRLGARFVREVTPEHVQQRVSLRYLLPEGGDGRERPTELVGRLLAFDPDVLLVVDRRGSLHVVPSGSVVASRVVPAHPRHAPEPVTGTEDAPLERTASRVLLLHDDGRVLLVAHAPVAGRRVWTAPGGGLEPGEGHLDGARRELCEEIGIDAPLGPCVWTRHVVFAFRSVWIEQDERWFLARTDQDAAAVVAAAPLPDPAVTEARWWTLDELERTDEALAPAAIAHYLRRLLREGPPSEPVDVGR